MLELDINADSVNYLITLLGQSLRNQYGLTAEEAPSVAKLKAQSFEILLKKTPKKLKSNNEAEIDDPQKALDMQIFAAKLNARSHPEKWTLFCKYKEQLEFVSNEAYFQEHPGSSILQFLLALQNVQQTTVIQVPELLVPAPFTLHSMKPNQHYPTELDTDFLHPIPKFFKGVEDIQPEYNPFATKFFSERNRSTDKLPPLAKDMQPNILPESISSLSKNPCSDFENLGIAPRAFRLPVQKQPERKSQVVKPIPETESNDVKSGDPRCFAWNWESLGCFGIPKNKPFVCETQKSLHLKSLESLKVKMKVMSMQQFMQDIKALTVGIQSDTFQHDELLVFHMQPNVTVEGLLPGTLANYAQHFIECGSCYKRLKTMIMKQDYKLLFEGFMFRALCSALDEYLFTFRQYVFAKEDQHLLEYYKRIKKSMQLLRKLSFALAVHPQNISIKPPMGSQFLGFIYREISRSTEHDYITLLMFILKRCCHVYFKHLQLWIYNGVLDDPSNELFIGYNEHTRHKTKQFYDKAYFLRKEAVPGFFQTYEQQILQCGKYTILLKSYKPNHKIFDLTQPDLKVCLTFEELQKQEIEILKYKKSAAELFFAPISVQQIMTERRQHRNQFLQQVNKRAIESLEKWLDEQHELALITAEQKRKLHAELTAQLEASRLHKIAERRANVELELISLRQAEALEEARLLGVNVNLQKRIEYYQELHELLEADMQPLEKLTLLTASTGSQTPGARTSPSTADFHSCDDENDPQTEEDKETEAEEEEFSECWTDNLEPLQKVEDLNANPADGVQIVDLNNLQQNKLNMLSGTNMQNCLNEDTASEKAKTSAAATLRANLPLTEAQRNKIRVLTQEYDQPLQVDVNLNSLPETQWTDLQRNRKRMLANVPFATTTTKTRSTLKLDLINDASQIKAVLCEKDLGTPMSTTSDVSLEIDTEPQSLADAQNNNNNNTSLEVPIINITPAAEEVPETTLTEPAPYARCEQLLQSNFQCAARCPLISLNRTQAERKSVKKSNLNVMSVITLTEFLQKSVIMPLQAHLELINNEVLRMFLIDLQLLSHFRSLRNYFFLMDGEFGSIICDSIIAQMEGGTKPHVLLNYQTLHGILETALGASLTGSHRHAENLSFIVSDIPDAFDLHTPHALQVLALSYRTTWPLNIILNTHAIEQYANVFKYLLKVRRIGWVLERVFYILKEAVTEHGKQILQSPQYRRIQQMRHKFYHFVHALQNHITANALQASWKTFKDDLLEAHCIEDIYRKHAKYVKRVTFLCMLNRRSAQYLSSIENIFKVALKFYHYMKGYPFQKAAGEQHFTHARFDKLLKEEQEFDQCLNYVIHLGNKIVKVGYQEELNNFITLINFNHYYNEKSREESEF